MHFHAAAVGVFDDLGRQVQRAQGAQPVFRVRKLCGGLCQRLALLLGQQPCQVLGVGLHSVGKREDHRASLGNGHLAPTGKGPVRGRNRGLGLFG